jgi:hypothetical protein
MQIGGEEMDKSYWINMPTWDDIVRDVEEGREKDKYTLMAAEAAELLKTLSRECPASEMPRAILDLRLCRVFLDDCEKKAA